MMTTETVTAARIFRSIAAELEETRRQVETQLAAIEGQAVPRFASMTGSTVHHLFTVRGKYLRPSIVMLTALATGKVSTSTKKLLSSVAAAVELIHSASLVHDDIIDGADMRRDQPALNAVYGDKVAVLVGDLLYDQAFSLLAGLVELGHERQIELFELLTSTTRRMCLGEIYEDQIALSPESVSFDDYLQVIDYKTASLMACCCTVSSIVVEADQDVRESAKSFGYHLGMSYQLVDDVNDYDSVFLAPEIMLDRAVEEANLAVKHLSCFEAGSYRSRLQDLPRLLLRRAERSINTLQPQAHHA